MRTKVEVCSVTQAREKRGGRHRPLSREALSPAAQRRLAELIDQLNPLGAIVARAKASRSAQSSGGSLGEGVGEAVGGGRPSSARRPKRRDIRLPPVGADVRRTYKGREIAVRVLDSGFEYDGKRFRSLSAIAKQVTGAHWNGLLFFGLVRQEK